jgi:hypothetical protein
MVLLSMRLIPSLSLPCFRLPQSLLFSSRIKRRWISFCHSGTHASFLEIDPIDVLVVFVFFVENERVNLLFPRPPLLLPKTLCHGKFSEFLSYYISR